MRTESTLPLYQARLSERNWSCQNHYSPKHSGKRSNRFCPSSNVDVAVAQLKAIVSCWKVFFGYSKLALAGVTCPKRLESAPVSAGSAYTVGTNKACGFESGARFCRSWTSVAAWTGVKVSWTGVSLPLKKGRRNRQNQAWQGHEVDGGGRRPRCSSGKPTDQCHASGCTLCRIDLGIHRTFSRRSTKEAPTSDCRSWLRQQSFAPAAASARYSVDCPPPAQSNPQSDKRRPNTPSLSETMENRAYLCLAGQLPPPGRPLRPTVDYVSSVLSSRLRINHLALSLK